MTMLVVIAGVLFGSLASVMVRCSTAPSLVLAAYRKDREAGESLADYLEKRVFAAATVTCVDPDPEDRAGFQTYIARYKAAWPWRRLRQRPWPDLLGKLPQAGELFPCASSEFCAIIKAIV